MKARSRLLHRLLISTVLLSVPASSAFAQEVEDVGARLKAVLAEHGTNIDWTSLSGDESQMVLEGVSVSTPDSSEKIAVGTVTIDDITEEDGAYTLGTVTLPNYAASQEGVDVKVSGAVFSGVELPAEGETDPLANMLFYDSVEVADVSVSNAGKLVFTLTGLSLDLTSAEDGQPLTFTGSAEKFTADLSTVEDAQTKAAIDAFGYQSISGSMELSGSWQPSDGRVQLSQYDLAIDDAGTLGLTFDLGGYTPDFIKSMQEMQKQMAAKPEDPDNSAQGLAMLGLMQQLTFHGASIRFEDDSLTGKVLEYVAGKQGQKPADIANQTKAVLPFMLAQLNNPDLTTQVTDAVSKFLDNPESLKIAAAPAQPVPFALIMAGAMASPAELTKTLGVSVTANE